MTAKPLYAGAVLDGNGAWSYRSNALERMFRRIAGDAPINLLRARNEVVHALRSGALGQAPPLNDGLPVAAIPSIAAGETCDRVLAEIDQDGFAFALDPRDEDYFNRRSLRVPRQQNLVDVTLLDGNICIRKRFRGFRFGARRWGDRPVPPQDWARRALWANLGLYLFTEAAALLRLQDLPFVPKLRAIDFDDRALYIDYVHGESLRSLAARGGAAVHDHDLARDPQLSNLSSRELERREVALLEAATGGGFRAEIASMTREINARGVAPLDIKLGNFIRGAATGLLYWIDFEICRLSSQPRWEVDLLAEQEVLEEVFQLSRRSPALTGRS